MSQHTAQFVVSAKEPEEHRVYCQDCGQTSDWLAHKWQCQDWWKKHLEQVERIKAHLGGHTPTLKNQQAYYQAQADNEKNTSKDRLLWQQLADELGHRLNAGGQSQDVMLPGMP